MNGDLQTLEAEADVRAYLSTQGLLGPAVSFLLRSVLPSEICKLALLKIQLVRVDIAASGRVGWLLFLTLTMYNFQAADAFFLHFLNSLRIFFDTFF